MGIGGRAGVTVHIGGDKEEIILWEWGEK